MAQLPNIPLATAVEENQGYSGSDEIAHAVLAPSIEPRSKTSQASVVELERMNVPSGLADVVAKASEACAVRYWIVDNSGSMGTQDGHSYANGRDLPCSRWTELGESLRWHGRVATALGARTEFRLLNSPRDGAPQRVVLAGDGAEHGMEGMAQLEMAIRSSPSGRTPLCQALNEVVAEVTALAPSLRAAQRVASVIVASDGEASDGDVARAMGPLADLPCCVVVRLCTDEDQVVQYWSEIDADIELELDVLDDIAGEGKEIHKHNPWVTYGEALHRIREFGAAPKLLDLLDERPFLPSEARDLIIMIFGVTVRADPNLEPKEFMAEVQALVGRTPPVYDPSRGRDNPWVLPPALAKGVLKLSGVCALM